MLLFVHPYVRGMMTVLHRLPALLCVAFFLGIVWLDLGAGLNIPALVWHDNRLHQAVAGHSIAALFAYVWLVTYILDAAFHPAFIKDAIVRTRRSMAFRVIDWAIPRDPSDANTTPELQEGGDGLRWYLGATFIPCAILLILPAFFVVDFSSPFIHFTDADSDPAGRPFIAERWPFALGVGLTLFGMRVLAWVGLRARKLLINTEQRQEKARKYWLNAVAASLLAILVVLFFTMCVLVNRDIWQPPPVTATCMLFGLFAGVSGAVWFHMRYLAIPILIAIVGWVCYCNSPAYKVRFPHMEAEYARLLDLEDHEEPALVLSEVVAGSPDPKTAEQEEADRVARLVASMLAQRDLQQTPASQFENLKIKGYTNPANYNELFRLYEATVRRMDGDEKAALRNWKEQFKTKTKDGRPKLVLVTATGGANRSGLWTAKVLHELHKELPDFPKHVRIITGASGGMVGASYYVGSLQPDGSLQEGFQPDDIAQDFITPIVNGLVFREVPLLTLPNDSYDRDRGEMLDRAMEGDVPSIDPGIRLRLHNVFSSSFLDWAPGENAGWRPSMIFSPMIVEDGRRLLISNRHVPFLTVNKGEFLLPNRPNFGAEGPSSGASRKVTNSQSKATSKRRGRVGEDDIDVYSRPAVEFFRLFPEARGRFHVSTAARMNATFPFLSPAVSLPTHSPRRVVDAGYFDNTGVSVASAWLYHNREWVARNCSGVLIVQVRDFASHRENRHLSLPGGDGVSFLPGLTGVVSAIDHARSASSNYRNDDELKKLAEYFREFFRANAALAPASGPKEFFTTAVFERYSDVGMSWYLSKADKKDILDSWKEGDGNMNPASLAKVRAWWSNR